MLVHRFLSISWMMLENPISYLIKIEKLYHFVSQIHRKLFFSMLQLIPYSHDFWTTFCSKIDHLSMEYEVNFFVLWLNSLKLVYAFFLLLLLTDWKLIFFEGGFLTWYLVLYIARLPYFVIFLIFQYTFCWFKSATKFYHFFFFAFSAFLLFFSFQLMLFIFMVSSPLTFHL